MPRETTYKFGTTQTIAVVTASVAVTNAVGAQTRVVRLKATTDLHIAFAVSPTATTSDPLLNAGETEYIDITPGQKIAAIRNSADGTLFITECTK